MKKIFKQRIMGLILILISLVFLIFLIMEPTNSPPECHDATALLFIVPLGLYMLFTKKYILIV